MLLKLFSKFLPSGDQKQAIEKLVRGLKSNKEHQVLLGATGTGKTFTMANIISQINKPTIILSHNKTLAAQLYSEFKQLFPENKVEYFISYFDYYRPEAYMPLSDTFIDKTSKNNWDIEAMRMSAVNSLLTRKDVIVVASVASIYGLMSPKGYKEMFLTISVGMNIKRRDFLFLLVDRHYSRNNIDLLPGTFQVKGDVIKIATPSNEDYYIIIDFDGDKIDKINKIDTMSGKIFETLDSILIYPAYMYAVQKDMLHSAIEKIKIELKQRIKYFKDNNKLLEAQRIEQRVKQDIESLEEFGVTSGMENYSRHIEGRQEGEKPWTILDYFPKDALMFIDESHMMIPQLNAMYNGDYSRKKNLVDYGFRLSSTLDNRPLKFKEFQKEYNFRKIYVSATPAEYELNKTNGEVVSQIIRPTGLLDPIIEIAPVVGQIEHMYDQLQNQKSKNERTFILTTTKRMAEELTRYLQEKGEKIAYIHSEHKTFEREEILRKLRRGIYTSIVGINLLREGIDIPEVSLVLIVDADKESFFRSTRALIQIIGRASRHINGKAIFYADNISKSMQETIDITANRRKLQEQHNKDNNILPQTIIKNIAPPIQVTNKDGAIENFFAKAKKDQKAKKALISDLRNQMLTASKNLNFERAAQLRDVIIELEV